MNFSTVERNGYEIGVDKKGVYYEALNSEWKQFGGSIERKEEYTTYNKFNHGKEQSISLNIPAGGSLLIKLKEEIVENDEKEITDDENVDEIRDLASAKKAKTKKTVTSKK